MPEVSSEAIQSPNHQDVEAPATCLGDQAIKCHTPILGPRNAIVDEIDSAPFPCGRVTMEF